MTAPRMATPKKAVPRKTATAAKPTSVAEWKKSASDTIELPSGKFMRIRKIGMQALVAAGVIPNSLMSIMQSALDKGKGVEDKVMANMAQNPDSLIDMVMMMNRITCMIAYEPQVHMPPKNEADRDEELLYADEVDEVDKSFLFQLVSGGTSDLETFRQEHAASMDAVSELTEIQLPSK